MAASGREEESSGPKRGFAFPRSFRSIRPPLKAPQRLIEGLKLLSAVAMYSLTLAILVVYCYLILTKGGASRASASGSLSRRMLIDRYPTHVQCDGARELELQFQ